MLPLVEELSEIPAIETALGVFADWPGLILFESALQRDALGRYSFLSADPVRNFSLGQPEFGCDPFLEMRAVLSAAGNRPRTLDGLPPFQGGVAGLLSYELGGCFEQLPMPLQDEFQLPVLQAGLYDWVLAWDHQAKRAWVISHGFGRQTGSGASTLQELQTAEQAQQRLEQVLTCLSVARCAFPVQSESVCSTASVVQRSPLDGCPGVTSSFSKPDYLLAVERVREHIHAGDIFQANLSQQLLIESTDAPLDIYRRLRTCNAAPFAAFYQHDDWAIVSASPERFLKVSDRTVTTRPIKGTRHRRSGPEADLFTRDELRQSEKDIAENVMIVDLLRNDLSRVCEPGTVSVPQLCTVETYETVQHLVSEVRGRLADGPTLDSQPAEEFGAGQLWKLLAATFPGGSITGAPKVRAMEIIADLEPTARGPYCGSLFYAGFDGAFDSSILIRTFVCRGGRVQCSVGGGIVAQSDPLREYQETLHKADGMLRAFGHGSPAK